MGWSARADACHVIDAWTRGCVANGGTQNVYVGTDGRRYFYEIGREQADGAIVGSVFRFRGDTELADRAGSFRISPDGDVVRWPTKFRGSLAEEASHAVTAR